ncbi:MAG: DUF2955 domain-containing protein [Cetobacterium sp.]
MSIDYTRDILKGLLALVLGLMLSKYTNYAFNFEIPIIAFGIVTSNQKFNLKDFIKENWWLIGAAAFGVFISELLREKYALFFIFTFAIFFSSFYYIHKNPKAILNTILGYSFTTVYSTYPSQNMEKMVSDIFIVTVIGCILGVFLSTIFGDNNSISKAIPLNKSSKKVNDTEKQIDTINVFLITTIVFITWVFYILFDIKDTFFAFATLALMYGNLDIKKIHKLTPFIISMHVTGCAIAIFYSYLVIGLSISVTLFGLSLALIFFPMLYFKYYGKNETTKAFAGGLIGATILPICLYLNPFSDMTSKASARALQITIMLIISLIFTKVLIVLEKNENS